MLTAIIQARMGSYRFPGKVMEEIKGKPLLFYVIKQTLSSKFINRVIISTSIAPEDKIIVAFCKENLSNCIIYLKKNIWGLTKKHPI